MPSGLVCAGLAVALLMDGCGAASDTPSEGTPTTGARADQGEGNAGPPPSTDACAIAGRGAWVGYSPSSSAPPAGVTRREDPNADQVGPTWHPPDTLQVSAAAASVPSGIEVRVTIENQSDAEVDLYLWDAGLGYVHLAATGEGVRQRVPTAPWPPEIYPQHTHFVMAPHAEWTLAATLVSACWDLPRGTETPVRWSLHFSGQEPNGETQVGR